MRILFLLICCGCSPLLAQDLTHPGIIDKCLEAQAGRVSVDLRMNPYYLRGDFDGDRRPDYAVAVVSAKKGKNGVLVCLNNSRTFLLGAGGPVFSDMPDDNFGSSVWEVFTKEETLDLRKYQRKGLRQIPKVKTETIAMIWEDGIGLIYWNGTAFKWIVHEP